MNFGKSIPNSITLCKLADYFGCSTDYLLGRTDIEIHIDSLIDKSNLKQVELINTYNSLPKENKKIFDSMLKFLTAYKSE